VPIENLEGGTQGREKPKGGRASLHMEGDEKDFPPGKDRAVSAFKGSREPSGMPRGRAEGEKNTKGSLSWAR